MIMSTPTTLGYALLGLLSLEPRSGYALRQVFALTPMGLYSSSPGAIYPALKSLQKADLVQKTTNSDISKSKSVFEITEQGEEKLVEWLRSPVSYEDVERREAELILRFSMMSHHLTLKEVKDFLLSLEQQTRELHSNLIVYLDTNREALGDIPSAAMQYGIDQVKTRAEWAQRTRKSLTSNPHNNASPK